MLLNQFNSLKYHVLNYHMYLVIKQRVLHKDRKKLMSHALSVLLKELGLQLLFKAEKKHEE